VEEGGEEEEGEGEGGGGGRERGPALAPKRPLDGEGFPNESPQRGRLGLFKGTKKKREARLMADNKLPFWGGGGASESGKVKRTI